MGKFIASKLVLTLLLFSIARLSYASDGRRAYIVHMDKSSKPDSFSSHHDWYTSTLSSLSSSDEDEPPVHLYTYKHVLDGFSVVLSQAHLDKLEELPSHAATYPESFGQPHTTHTPEFLGLNRNTGLWPASKFGDDVIIGLIDTGIWPENESFNDRNMPPVPKRWRGTCETGVEFNTSHCNKKLIGARKFSQGMKQHRLNISTTEDYDSPRDYYGHGSHVASIAAGNRVQNVDYFGYARGTARGMAPSARIAMYKVLFYGEDPDSDDYVAAAATDVLAGIDQAIEDGVDIMSLSVGFPETPFFENPIAIGAFAAMKKGIFVICAAGNVGPNRYTMVNGAPWMTAVGAGTIDRQFGAHVTIGDGIITATGQSIYPENLFVSRVPIYFGHGNRSKELCEWGSLDPKEVAGKFIFCDHDNESSPFRQKSETLFRYGADIAGAIGAIFSGYDGELKGPEDFYQPLVLVNKKDGDSIKNYLLNTPNTTVSIEFGKTILGTKPAPRVANFSSRGPDRRSPWILKPDILAPGYHILAAWVPNRAFQQIREDDYLMTDYAILSGTSMSCPHAAGIAALLKAIHRDWSSAAIRSAMMTTAYVKDNANGIIRDMSNGASSTPLDFGAGHIDPNKAMDPGLVYDIEVDDYINYLCALNYTNQQIQIIIGTSNYTCSQASLDLNYPSFMVILNNTKTTSLTFKRTLMSVVDTVSVYNAILEVPQGMKVVVVPPVLSFSGKYSKAEFNLTVDINLEAAGLIPQRDYLGNYGFLTWYEAKGTRIVRSPIVSAIASTENP